MVVATDDWRVDPAQLPYAVVQVDGDGCVTHHNAAAQQLLSHATAGQPLIGCVLASLVEQSAALADAVAQGSTATVLIRRADAAVVVRAVCVGGAGVVLLLEEASMAWSLLAQLTHKISQPLSAAMSALELALLVDPLDAPVRAKVERALEQVGRASALLQAAAAEART